MLKLKLLSIAFLSGLSLSCFADSSKVTNTPTSQDIRCTSTVPDYSEKAKLRFIKDWATYVAQNSFSLNHDDLENHLKQLQFCYSSSGWNQFNQALHKSGNLNLINQHHLKANTDVIGPIEVNHHPKYSSWTAMIPMRVVYQNQTQRISQEMNVHLTINQQSDNHLAVIQIVGRPTDKKLPSH